MLQTQLSREVQKMVQINVSQLLKAPIGTIRNYTVHDKVDIADCIIPIQGEIELMRTDRSILVKGTLYSEIEITCSRCLSLFNCPLTLNIEEEYFSLTDIVSGASLSLPDEPGYFTINEHHILDLTEVIRQYALLAVPMKPLCRRNCAGLCPNCGQNLNQGSCDCSPQKRKPYWAELSKLTLASDVVINKQKGTE